jgi:glycosyltransferase involved in cell wall biosynthesis
VSDFLTSTTGVPSVLGMVQLYNGTAAWRVIWPMEYLRRHGYPVMWGYNGERETATVTAYADVVVMHRLAWNFADYPKALLWRDILHRDGKVLVYELDDDILSPEILQRIRRAKMWAKADEVIDAERRAHLWSMQLCDGVICSTEALAEVCRALTDKPVLVVPNAIDVDRFRAGMAIEPRKAADAPPTIGWIGGNRPDTDAFKLAAAWSRLARKYPKLNFIVGGFPLGALVTSVPQDRLTLIPWRQIDAYPRAFANIDIGCAPLAPEKFNVAKSPIKAYEYAVAGAAVCASPLVYGEVLEHGKTGMICESVEEWTAALSVLLDYPEQRRAMASALQEEVLSKYSLSANAGRWPEAWGAILADFRVRILRSPRVGGRLRSRYSVQSTQPTREVVEQEFYRGSALHKAQVVWPRQLQVQ